MKHRLSIQEYIDGIIKGDRIVLAKAITLAESQLDNDREVSELILDKIISRTGNSFRIGITGAPGVGKSTFIEAFGKYVIQTHRKKVAILTVDPSSKLTKGSILGDKTRMTELGKMSDAFIRPAPAGDSVGGITDRTREAIFLCEAAGYELIIVETVGVGQSETVVKNIVDLFILLLLAGAGDELQGIKKGIMEVADLIVITKADHSNKNQATKAQAEYQHALNLFQPNDSGWFPRVLTCSALTGEGIESIWDSKEEFKHLLNNNGYFYLRRKHQLVDWMYDYFDLLIKSEITKSKTMTLFKNSLETDVKNKLIPPQKAAHKLLSEFLKSLK